MTFGVTHPREISHSLFQPPCNYIVYKGCWGQTRFWLNISHLLWLQNTCLLDENSAIWNRHSALFTMQNDVRDGRLCCCGATLGERCWPVGNLQVGLSLGFSLCVSCSLVSFYSTKVRVWDLVLFGATSHCVALPKHALKQVVKSC